MTLSNCTRRELLSYAACAAFAGLCPAQKPVATISLESLLREMVDRNALARYPDPSYTCQQASSYDRRSIDPKQSGWFANNDYSQFIRSEQRGGRTEWVMMDAEGPGAVVRFWMGAPVPQHGPTGTLRFYFDGSEEPAIETVADKLLSGESFVREPLAAVRSIGRNLYLPIPYARRCKITYDRPNHWKSKNDEDCAWYNINYRTYPRRTDLQTFTMGEFEAARTLVDQIGKNLLTIDQYSGLGTRTTPQETRTLRPGSSITQTLSGPAAVRKLSLRIAADNLPQALRDTVLSLEFDGEETVWSPVGDFFGSGIGLNPFHDWWRAVDNDGTMSCWWVMPFNDSCKVRLDNIGGQTLDVGFGPLVSGPWQWDDRSMHFHANWRQQYGIDTKKEDGLDWNYIEIAGQGVYAGDTLTIHNGSSEWWGEGDEKIFVDGESFPSNFGTGTEDYYGYSFGDRGVFFEAPFHAQPRADGNHQPGYTVNTRTRSLDAIPFMKALKFDMEIWHWAKTTMTYAVTTYWYARPGATSNRVPERAEATRAIQM
jgi:hypothetical protein